MDIDITTYLRFLLALVFVLGLIVLAARLARRFGYGGFSLAHRSAPRRLQVLEQAALDPRHRLVLLRRDDVAHLVLLGPGAPLALETGIPLETGTARSAGARPPAPGTDAALS